MRNNTTTRVAGAILLAAVLTTLAPAAAAPTGDDFWIRLATCESGLGQTSPNLFQLSPDTAAKVGITGTEPYSVQLAAAQRWAAILEAQGTDPGSRSGWPECWWVALGSGAEPQPGRLRETPAPGEDDEPAPAKRAEPVPAHLALTG